MNDNVDKESQFRSVLKKTILDMKRLELQLSSYSEPIAIIGMSCRFPGGANNPSSYWELLSQNSDCISEIPANRWNADDYYDPNPNVPGKMITKLGGFLNVDVSAFDAHYFGISPREAEYMDPQQRLLLEVSYEAIHSAGIDLQSLKNSLTGVFMGMCSHDYMDLITATGDKSRINPYMATGNTSSTATGRISFSLGLRGPNFAVDTACSSSLVAIDEACKNLRTGDANLALAGGVNLILAPDLSIDFSQASMLAPDGHCKTFDASANGYVRGEGCGVIVLKRLSDAVRDGDAILAVIKASGINQDGASSGLTVPNGDAQEALIRKVLDQAKLQAIDIEYVEAHGTGTSLGDPIEVRALGATYGQRDAAHPLKLGSVKTNIGHLEGAAGIAGVIKVILALQHETLPAHLHFKQLNPHIDANFPLEIVTKNQAWPRGERIRRAGISSFGFSGTNAHLILEEGPQWSYEQLTQQQTRLLSQPVFQREHYWVEGIRPAVGRTFNAVHPLLGEMHTSPNDEFFYLGGLNLSSLSYLRDHQVFDYVVYPGAGYIEMMLAAGFYGIGEGAITLRDVSIEAALSFPGGKPIDTEVLMTSSEQGYQVEVYSKKTGSSVWQCHARGALTVSDEKLTASGLSLDVLKERCQQAVEARDFYQFMSETGLHYGPYFQTLKTIYLGEKEALARLTLDDQAKGYLAHPAVLDGCFQLSASSLLNQKQASAYLPIACDKVTLYVPLEDEVYVHWQEVSLTETALMGNLTVFSAAGQVLAVVEGLQTRKASQQALQHMLTHEKNVADWLYEWTWEPNVLSEISITEPIGHWLLFGDGGVAEGLMQLIEQHGGSYECIAQASLPASQEGFADLLFIALMQEQPLSGVVHLSSLGAYEPLSAEAIRDAQVFGTQSYLHLCQAMVSLHDSLNAPLYLITQDILSTNLAHSPLLATFKTILAEHPELENKLIDFEGQYTMSLLWQVLFTKNHEELVMIKEDACFVPRLIKARHREEPMDFPVHANASYLITGGRGGLGLRLAQWLCDKGAGRVVLTGRRSLDEEGREALASIQQGNTEIIYEVMDVSQETEVASLMKDLQQGDKPLKGLFHLAVVLEDMPLMKLDWPSFERVFAPKVYGSFFLHQYSQDLDFFVLFSSVSSSFGNPGQTNYAAANGFMDALCEYRQQQKLPGQSLSWGPWAEVGLAKNLMARHEKLGFIAMNPKDGMRAFDAALTLPGSHLTLVDMIWPNFAKNKIELPLWYQAFAQKKSSKDTLLARLETVEMSERPALVKQCVKNIVQSVLGFSSAKTIPEKKGFFQMGLDSLMGIELKNRLQSEIVSCHNRRVSACHDTCINPSRARLQAEFLKNI